MLHYISEGGLIIVGAYFVYYFTKKYTDLQEKYVELQEFIQNKLIGVVENNTRVMENLTHLVHELREDIREEFCRVRRRLDDLEKIEKK